MTEIPQTPGPRPLIEGQFEYKGFKVPASTVKGCALAALGLGVPALCCGTGLVMNMLGGAVGSPETAMTGLCLVGCSTGLLGVSAVGAVITSHERIGNFITNWTNTIEKVSATFGGKKASSNVEDSSGGEDLPPAI